MQNQDWPTAPRGCTCSRNGERCIGAIEGLVRPRSSTSRSVSAAISWSTAGGAPCHLVAGELTVRRCGDAETRRALIGLRQAVIEDHHSPARAGLSLPSRVNGDVLTFGADGPNVQVINRVAAESAATVTTVDIDPSRGPDRVADICADDLGGPYDVVVCSEVLEHVVDPHRAIQGLFKALKPGGLLAVTTPFLFPIHDAPIDHFRFTSHGLAMLLDDFDEVQIEPKGGWFRAQLNLTARLYRDWKGPAKAAGWVMVVLSRLLLPLDRPLERLLPAPSITAGYLVTARKPS